MVGRKYSWLAPLASLSSLCPYSGPAVLLKLERLSILWRRIRRISPQYSYGSTNTDSTGVLEKDVPNYSYGNTNTDSTGVLEKDVTKYGYGNTNTDSIGVPKCSYGNTNTDSSGVLEKDVPKYS